MLFCIPLTISSLIHTILLVWYQNRLSFLTKYFCNTFSIIFI
nr:MAG TPA: hypothetical protein [Caudoviricetes sp.]